MSRVLCTLVWNSFIRSPKGFSFDSPEVHAGNYNGQWIRSPQSIATLMHALLNNSFKRSEAFYFRFCQYGVPSVAHGFRQKSSVFCCIVLLACIMRYIRNNCSCSRLLHFHHHQVRGINVMPVGCDRCNVEICAIHVHANWGFECIRLARIVPSSKSGVCMR